MPYPAPPRPVVTLLLVVVRFIQNCQWRINITPTVYHVVNQTTTSEFSDPRKSPRTYAPAAPRPNTNSNRERATLSPVTRTHHRGHFWVHFSTLDGHRRVLTPLRTLRIADRDCDDADPRESNRVCTHDSEPRHLPARRASESQWQAPAPGQIGSRRSRSTRLASRGAMRSAQSPAEPGRGFA
jgi:hypothetical protein